MVAETHDVIEFPEQPQIAPIPGKATLYAKLARVMGKVNRIEKTGENTHFKYNYVTDADVADAVRSALAEEKVAFLPDMIEDTREGNKVTVWFEFTFACGDTGATISKRWKGESIDSQDKGISKAATSAEKYFLMKTFLMSSENAKEDADSGPEPEEKTAPTKKQERRAPVVEKPSAVSPVAVSEAPVTEGNTKVEAQPESVPEDYPNLRTILRDSGFKSIASITVKESGFMRVEFNGMMNAAVIRPKLVEAFADRLGAVANGYFDVKWSEG